MVMPARVADAQGRRCAVEWAVELDARAAFAGATRLHKGVSKPEG
jgi:hypothetical protein